MAFHGGLCQHSLLSWYDRGELATYFNHEYNIGCKLSVVPMKGWNRSMTFADTGLVWIPTSPNIPEATTPWFYPATGILGELQIVSIGIGYTLPFKVVGAPWIDADAFANKLNAQNFLEFRLFLSTSSHLVANLPKRNAMEYYSLSPIRKHISQSRRNTS